ncbi:hypothetical protein [Flagellimonas flava]|uniref:Uncharacterized protein n=1 Tax=Flagellimonas flava TaxID=570519 RepID=A0A1M5LVJ5_9FLAO|nr:hypothetical protein [Allomuricauda flava]SHG69152.1 hypothetical protein SAMN04488116_2117 [Allomuricauda flava]
MRYVCLIFCLMMLGCHDAQVTTLEEIIHQEKQFFTPNYLQSNMEEGFEVLNLDTYNNYGDLLDAMETLSCEEKGIGLKFEHEGISYHTTGFAECPTSWVIDCYFNRNMVMVKNDSLRHFTKKRHISELQNEIMEFNDYSGYQGLRGNRRLKPSLLFLYVEDKYPIAKTKEVLKEIVTQFEGINKELGHQKYRYHLQFERFSNFDIPPPPPPPALDE